MNKILISTIIAFTVGVAATLGVVKLVDIYQQEMAEKEEIFDQFCEIIIDGGNVDEIYE